MASQIHIYERIQVSKLFGRLRDWTEWLDAAEIGAQSTFALLWASASILASGLVTYVMVDPRPVVIAISAVTIGGGALAFTYTGIRLCVYRHRHLHPKVPRLRTSQYHPASIEFIQRVHETG